jgi:hypothetical protein
MRARSTSGGFANVGTVVVARSQPYGLDQPAFFQTGLAHDKPDWPTKGICIPGNTILSQSLALGANFRSRSRIQEF